MVFGGKYYTPNISEVDLQSYIGTIDVKINCIKKRIKLVGEAVNKMIDKGTIKGEHAKHITKE